MTNNQKTAAMWGGAVAMGLLAWHFSPSFGEGKTHCLIMPEDAPPERRDFCKWRARKWGIGAFALTLTAGYLMSR